MDRADVISSLKGRQAELQALGLSQISLFGSTARGGETATSDVDLAVTIDRSVGIDLFRFAALTEHLQHMLGTHVDLVVEPARNARIQAEIDRDRVRVF